MPIDTHVEGDAGQCRDTGRWLGDVARAAHDAGTTINSARQTSAGSWTGGAGEGYREQAGRLVREADDAGEKARSGSTALSTFAGSVDAAKDAMARARAIATAGGLTVAGETIQDPVPAPALPTGPGPSMSPAQEGSFTLAAHEAERQRVAYDQAKVVADDANTAYDRAQQALIDALNPLARDLRTLKDVQTKASYAYGLPTALSAAAKKWGDKIAPLEERAALWRNLNEGSVMSPSGRAAAYARQIEYEQSARSARGVAASNTRWLLGPLKSKPAAAVFDLLAKNPGTLVSGTSRLARGGQAVLGRLPYVGLAATALGVGADLENGKGVGNAVARNAIPFAAGTAVTAGASAAGGWAVGSGLLAASLAGGPVTLAAVGLGVAASIGVGYVVDHYGDDIAEGVGDGLEWAGDKLGSIF